MDEKDTVIQSQGSGPVKIRSKWARIALWCVIFGYLAPLFGWVITQSLPIDSSYTLIYAVGYLFFFFVFASAISTIVGLIIGIIALVQITRSKGKIQGKSKAVTAVVFVFSISPVCNRNCHGRNGNAAMEFLLEPSFGTWKVT
jgi:hypothetical protein